MKRILTYALLFLSLSVATAQDVPRILTFKEYMEIVNREHPLAYTAALQIKKGEADVRSNRGDFDPKLFQETNAKQYDGTNYYNLAQGGLKVPTWFGIDLEGGYQRNSGDFLNPQN